MSFVTKMCIRDRNDGYEAVQVGFGEVKISRVNKPQAGHFKKADVAPKKVLKEFRRVLFRSPNIRENLYRNPFGSQPVFL